MRKALRIGSFVALLVLLAALSAVLVLTVGFTQGVSINGGQTTYTDAPLVCAWNVTADTTAIDVAWYLDGTPYSSSYDNTTLNTTSTIPPNDTVKNEDWRCTVTLFNATANATQSANLTIQNSAPTTPLFTNASGSVMGTWANVVEGQTSTYTLNSSDLDNDTLIYYLKAAGFCTVTDSATGAVSCTPTHADVSLPNQSEVVTQKNITFWVDDNDPLYAKSASLTVTFNITPVNDPPVLSIPTQTTNVTAVFNQTFAASDQEADYPLAVSVTNATDAAIRNDITATVEMNSTLRIVYFTSPVQYTDVGNRTVVLNLTDSRNASSLITFTLDILSVNRPPYFTSITPSSFNSSQNRTYVLSQGQNIIINLSANDPDTSDRSETITFSDNSSNFTTNTSVSLATNTTDAQGFIDFTATNADVGNHSVLITINDTRATNTTTLNFTILNVNDPPLIHDQSYNASNTGYNLTTAAGINVTPLIAYLNAPFHYQVNVSDDDLYLRPPWGCEMLNWTTNTSTFNITSGATCGDAGGLVSFTPTGLPRNETVNITVTDAGGLSDSRIITVEIRDNAPPTLQPLPAWNTSEGILWTYNLSLYANDTDPGDYVADYAVQVIGANLSGFSVDSTSGVISFLPDQSQIGNYAANVTVTDTHGATASQPLNIAINNTPDPPVWDAYDFGGQTIVATHEFYFQLIAKDKDLLIPGGGENLTFSSNLSWVSITYQQTVNDTVYALLSFTPNSSQVGTQTVQLNVTDATGLVNTTDVTFTVLAKTNPPDILFIRPYGNASANRSIVQDWRNVTGVTPLVENVTLPENTRGVVFAVNATDDVTPVGSLLYTWYYDGVESRSGTGDNYKNDSLSFGFFSAGNHTVSVTVNDTTLESTAWTWNLAVQNVDRPPVLLGNFTDSKNNLNISGNSPVYLNYFVYNTGAGGFYDPDDDFNSDGLIDGNETLNLTYSATSCAVASFAFSGNDLTVTPISVGSCTVEFTATDPYGLSATSNLVNVTVTQVPQGAQAVTISSGGGGGASSTSSTSVVPINHDVVKPQPLNIIAPRLVTIYQNDTIVVPIKLSSNWTAPLNGIMLSATANRTGISMSFDSNYVEQLLPNASTEVHLTVQGYRLGEDFEVTVHANVSDPGFQDDALILFNSIEQSQEGKDVQLKVTFAQDLLSQHAECQELNEVLSQAATHLKQGDVKGAGDLVDSVINGCRYLISKTQETQSPGIVRTPFIDISDATLTLLAYLALGAFIIIAAAALLYYHYKTKEEYNF